jgi:hypothetical protein
MTVQPVPVTIAQLLATATQAAANTDKHRAAMAQVAAQIRAQMPVPLPAERVTRP